jgi:mRNA interferase RelE/StbE
MLERISTLREVPNLKKMEGYKTYYRIKIGQYHIGFELTSSDTIHMILVAHRKEIYRYFP